MRGLRRRRSCAVWSLWCVHVPAPFSHLLCVCADHPVVPVIKAERKPHALPPLPDFSQARIDHNLEYIYVPGVSSPFDDPLVQLIRQIAAYSGTLKSSDGYLGVSSAMPCHRILPGHATPSPHTFLTHILREHWAGEDLLGGGRGAWRPPKFRGGGEKGLQGATSLFPQYKCLKFWLQLAYGESGEQGCSFQSVQPFKKSVSAAFGSATTRFKKPLMTSHPPTTIGMQIRLEFNLNSSEFVPNSNSCEFERLRFQHIHNESLYTFPPNGANSYRIRIRASSCEFEPPTLHHHHRCQVQRTLAGQQSTTSEHPDWLRWKVT